MNSAIFSGVICGKTNITSNKLIINLLDNCNNSHSFIYKPVKKVRYGLNILDSVEIEARMGKTDLPSVINLSRSFSAHTIPPANLENYYIVAELTSLLSKKIKSSDGFYDVLKIYQEYLMTEFISELTLYFLRDILFVFGLNPDPLPTGKYFDYREGVFTNQQPLHPDFSDAVLVRHFLISSNEITTCAILKNASQRYEVFTYLLRFLQTQLDIDFTLKSITVLKETR